MVSANIAFIPEVFKLTIFIFDHTADLIFRIPFTHSITKFMKQCPYRIVVLVPKLTAVHHGVGLETLPVVTMLALVAFLVLLPTMLCTSAARADRDKSTDWMWRIAAQAHF